MTNTILSQHEKLTGKSNYTAWKDRMHDILEDDEDFNVFYKKNVQPPTIDIKIIYILGSSLG